MLVSSSPKIQTVAEAARQVALAQERGRRVVMCHGCFDIVHPGHIRHLQQAAKQGDTLLVTITGDAAIAKGTGRPLIPQELRAENLAALNCVGMVAIAAGATAIELLQTIRPDVYVKGREYENNRDPRFQAEREVVESYGGRVVFTSGDVIFSSTALISALEESAHPFQSRLRQLTEQHALTQGRLEPIIESFRGRKVVVIGETITDTYVMCDRPDVAGEAPVMTLRPIEYRSFDGGAAIVAKHLAAMGARPVLVTGLPMSAASESFRQRLALEGVDVQPVEIDQPLIEKQRFLVGSAKVMKLDLGEPATLDLTQQKSLVAAAVQAAKRCEAAIITDFGQGLLTSALLTELCRQVRPHVQLMTGDISGRRSSLLAMQAMDLLCPSESEIRDATHDYSSGLSTVVWNMLAHTASKNAIITLGDEGLIAFSPIPGLDLKPTDWASRLDAQHVPSFAPYAVDQLGCGDSLLAAATLALASGGSLVDAAVLGSIAAAAQTQRLGNAVIGAAELRRGIRRLAESQLTFTAVPSPATIAV